MNYKKIIIWLFIPLIAGCSLIDRSVKKPYYRDQESELSWELDRSTKFDSLNTEIGKKNKMIDSLLTILDEQNFTIDSLSLALEISNSRIAVNDEFQIPRSIVFAGRDFDLSNERIFTKFAKIYKQELRSAHRYIPRSGRYFSIFDSVFTEYEIPLDAKYIAVIESSLNPLAASRVGAVGIWQFMKKTAKGYGFKIDSFIDERKNVIKSTIGAAKYLKNSYNYLSRQGVEDWLLAFSAYNAGAGSISRVIKEQNADDFFDLILRADETHNFIWRAVAVKLIFENEMEIFGKKLERNLPLLELTRTVELSLNGHYKIDDWAAAQGTSIGKVWELNPWINIYKRQRKLYSAINDVVLPPGKYSILLPKDCIPDKSDLTKIEQQFQKENAGYFTHHIVKKGDTLYDIARKYKTTVGKIKSLNNLHSDIIRPGQKLNLYGAKSGTSHYYVVRKGDSVGTIAEKVGVNSKHLISRNSLKSKNGIVLIYPGQKLFY